MKLYRIKIKPLTSYASLLQSDTFFGAFCWSYKYLYGEQNLEDFLKKNLKEGPQLVFSNAFPADYLPLPMGSYDSDRGNETASDKIAARKAYQDNKKWKKCSLVSKEAFMNIQMGNRKGYTRFLLGEQTYQVEVTHNMVGRDSGTVNKSDDNSGNLFVREEFFADKDVFFDVYVLSNMDRSLISDVLKLMFELGIGANKSTGKGHFMLTPFKNGGFLKEEEGLVDIGQANGYMALSNFIPASDDPTKGWYKTLVKYGKLDREYASSHYPFKKPLLFLQAGAVFQTNVIKSFYGKFVTDVSTINNVVVNACTIALPLYIPEEVKK